MPNDSDQHRLLQFCDILDTEGMLVPKEKEEAATEKEKKRPSKKRKREILIDSDKYISFHKTRNKWVVRITKDGKQFHVGTFATRKDATTARDSFLKGEIVINPSEKKSPHGKHISFHKASSKYHVQVWMNSKLERVGYFSSKDKAIKARDNFLEFHGRASVPKPKSENTSSADATNTTTTATVSSSKTRPVNKKVPATAKTTRPTKKVKK